MFAILDGIMITGLHHVQLAMPPGREEDAVAFYEGVLGIPQVPKPAHLAARGGCWFETEDVRVHLGVEEDFRPAAKGHPALLVDKLEELRAQLINHGIATYEDAPPRLHPLLCPGPFWQPARIPLFRRLSIGAAVILNQ